MLQGVDRPELLAEAMLRVAMMYRRIGQFDESVTLAMQAMEIAKRSRNALALTYAHQGLAISFGQSNRQPEAEEHNLRMREYAQAAQSKLLEAYALTSLGYGAALRGDYRLAEARHREAVALFRATGAPFGIAHGLSGLADVFRRQHQHTVALSLLGEVADIFRRHANKIGLWFALNALSENHEARGDRAAALAGAEQAYALAKEIGLPVYRSDSAQRLAVLAAAAGHHKQAYAFAAEASTLSAQAAREKSSARMIELARRY